MVGKIQKDPQQSSKEPIRISASPHYQTQVTVKLNFNVNDYSKVLNRNLFYVYHILRGIIRMIFYMNKTGKSFWVFKS